MLNKKRAPFGLAGLGGAERSRTENIHTIPSAGVQPRCGFRVDSCLQCGNFLEQIHCAGVCLFTGGKRSFLFAMLPCSHGGFVTRHAEEVLA